MIFTPAWNWWTTQLHYLFTDGCGGVANCHTCHAHIRFVDFLRSDSANRHIFGCGDPWVGPMTPRFELGQDFCTVHLTAKFHHTMFNRSEAIVLTNRCHWKHPPRSAVLHRWVKIHDNWTVVTCRWLIDNHDMFWCRPFCQESVDHRRLRPVVPCLKS